MELEPYLVGLVLVGFLMLGVVVFSRVVTGQPLSIPILYVALGAAAFSLPLGLPGVDPMQYGDLTEKLTELAVVLALMSTGLKLDRVPGLRRWASTWRLLAITMPLSIAGAALLGWGVAGLAIPTALLLGAVIAPTDPVLASAVQVREPGEGVEEAPVEDQQGRHHEVRFALTSEAGLNDSLAFPFTYLAILVLANGVDPAGWLETWVLEYVLYKLGVGLVAGVVLGWGLARLVFRLAAETRHAESVQGLEALGATLFIYGLTEVLGGYGFLAVFVGALVLRDYERKHDYNDTLHDVAEKSEQVMMVLVLVAFGGATVSGLFDPLSLADVAVALALVFVVRPLAGMIGLAGFDRNPWERPVISFFGVRGVGSFYYLAYALNEASFPGAQRIWAIVGCTVLISILVHGVVVTPAVERLEAEVGSEAV